MGVIESFFGGHEHGHIVASPCSCPQSMFMSAINTSEMTQNDFKMTLRPCEKHLVHLRTHLGSYWGSFWVLMRVSLAGIDMYWLQLVPAINTSEMTQNDFKMTVRHCEKHLVHLRTHLGSYWGSFWVLLRVSLAGIIPGTGHMATIYVRHKYIRNDPK